MPERLVGEGVRSKWWIGRTHIHPLWSMGRGGGGGIQIKTGRRVAAGIFKKNWPHALVSAHSKSTKCKRPVARKAAEGGTVRDGRPTIRTEGGGATGPPVGVEQVRR